jgi:hypothetical protein
MDISKMFEILLNFCPLSLLSFSRNRWQIEEEEKISGEEKKQRSPSRQQPI